MPKMWNKYLYPKHQIFTDECQWEQWHSSITTDLGGLSAGFRSEMLLRGYSMIGEMTGEISFIQGWVLAITGRLPNRDEDRLLNAMFINTALADPRFWFNRVARLGATVKSSPAACIAAGVLTNEADFFSSGAAFNTATFLQEALQKVISDKQSLDELIEQNISRHEIVGGFGRVLARGPDERNPALLEVARSCGLDGGQHLALARQIETLLQTKKNSNIYMNNGGLKCALLSDLGFTPLQISVFYTLMLIIGIAGNVVEAYQRPPGEFLPLACDDIEYTGPTSVRSPNMQLPRQTIMHNSSKGRIVIMDSISFISEQNRDDVIACGSHGGLTAAEHCLDYSPKAIFFNDAGRGKNNAGISGLACLDNAGIPAAAVDTNTAMIGDGLDLFHHGYISALNKHAYKRGVRKKMTVKKAAFKLL